jgi:predicted nuclease of restriction endonuclease-like (RecB) superfamily
MVVKKKTTAIAGRMATEPASESRSPHPQDYTELLEDLKNRIRQTQVRAATAANHELIRLYWDIGREIVQRQDREGWGAKVIDRLAGDLQKAFPGIAGFSVRNIKRMRAFFLAYAPQVAIMPQAVAQLDGPSLPQFVAEIPWGHNLAQQMLKDPYVFDFLTLADDARERELHRGLLEHLRDFILELGVGFAFVGSQYHLRAVPPEP